MGDAKIFGLKNLLRKPLSPRSKRYFIVSDVMVSEEMRFDPNEAFTLQTAKGENDTVHGHKQEISKHERHVNLRTASLFKSIRLV